MTRTVLSLLLLVTLSISCSSAGEGPSGQGHARSRGDLPQRLEAFLSQAAGSGFAGSVLVARDGRILLHKGYGFSDRQRTRPVEAETPFWVASISKQFTAAAILKLAEQGRLSLEDPIARHFPDVPEDKRGITIHHLLSHTAGFRQKYLADGIADRGEAVRAVLSQPLAAVLFTYPEEKTVVIVASNAGDRGGMAAARSLSEDLEKLIFQETPEASEAHGSAQ